MKNKICFLMTSIAFACLSNSTAFAQIGPDLRPPGLEEGHPINSYTSNGSKSDRFVDQSWVLNTGDVVFSAAKKRQLTSEAPSTIHVLTDKDIAAHGWRTIAEVLRHIPGVQTLTTKSQFQSVMIRGLVGTEDNNSRILWLQNGIPMNDVRDSGIWLDETYPVELIKRIEVVLGPGSALYGSGAFQGVVNIFTKDPDDIGKYGEYRIAMQNNLTFKASAIAAYKSENGKLGILGHVAGNTTQGSGLIGDYVYTNYAMEQGVANTQDNNLATSSRFENIDSNSQKHWYNINLKLFYEDFKWNLGFTDIYAGAEGSIIVPGLSYDVKDMDKNSGLINTGSVESLTPYRFDRREFYNDFIYETNFTEDISFMTLLSYRYLYYDHQNYGSYATNGAQTDFPHIGFDPSGDASATINKETISYDSRIKTHQHKLYGLAQVNWQIYQANELTGGLVLEYQHLQSNDMMDGVSSRGTFDDNRGRYIKATDIGQLTPSIFIQDEQRFWNDRIILTAGLRFDAYRIYGSDDFDMDPAPSWRFAFLGKWTDWMTMRISYGYSFKEPSFFQLFANTYDYYGDPTLKPERLHNAELSFLFTPTYFLKLRLDGFATFMEDLISMNYQSEDADNEQFSGVKGYYLPTQDSKAQLFGFEFSLDANIQNNWNLYAHYNFLYSRSTDTKSDEKQAYKRIPDDALHRLKLGATYSDDRVSADLAMFLVGGMPSSSNDASQTIIKDWQTPLYAIVQPEVMIALPANFAVGVQGSYAFSEGMTKSPSYRYYFEKIGVPVPRYSVLFSLQYPFKNNQ